MGYYSDEAKNDLILKTVKDEMLANEVAECVGLEDFKTTHSNLTQLGFPAHVFAHNDNFLNHPEFVLELLESEPILCLTLLTHQGSKLPDALMWYAMNDELCSGAAFRYCENPVLLQRAWDERIFHDTLDYSSWISNLYTPESCLVDFARSVYTSVTQVGAGSNSKGRKPIVVRIPAELPEPYSYNVSTAKGKRPSPLSALSHYVMSKKPAEWNFPDEVLSVMADEGSTLFLSIAYRKELDPEVFGQKLYRLSLDKLRARETYLFFRDYLLDKEQPSYADEVAYYILKNHYEAAGNGDIEISLFPSEFLKASAATYLRTQAGEPDKAVL